MEAVINFWKSIAAPMNLGFYIDFLKYREVPVNFAHIACKPNTHSPYSNLVVQDEKGWISEYFRNCPKDTVEVVFIRDEHSCGNFIIGHLLSKLYPNMKTLIFDRYRGFVEGISDGVLLQNLESLILHGSQGIDTFYEFSKALPSVKYIFMEEDYEYQNHEGLFQIQLDKSALQGVVFQSSSFAREQKGISTFPPLQGWVLMEEVLYDDSLIQGDTWSLFQYLRRSSQDK
jgi:hypothetical protein